MSRLTNHIKSVVVSWSRDLVISLPLLLLTGCSPRVTTSFWRIGTPSDSTREGYAVLYEGKKMRHCYPITEWTEQLSPITNNQSSLPDTYHSLHHHGVAVESELMAYRIYFDKKQTIDPYCKRKPQLELAQSHWYPNDSLLAAGYGDDILRVSGTVGVGSVKYWQTLQTGEAANNHCHFFLTVVGATKENHPVATTVEDWFAYLRKWAKNLR